MSGAWDDRKKGLEEEYFRRKDQEALEKLRADKLAQEQARQTEASALECPKCDGILAELVYEDVHIDRCSNCHGIWLDEGELERLTAKEESGGWLSRMFKSFGD